MIEAMQRMKGRSVTVEMPPHPGRLILERMPALNLTVETVSAALGISPESLTAAPAAGMDALGCTLHLRVPAPQKASFVALMRLPSEHQNAPTGLKSRPGDQGQREPQQSQGARRGKEDYTLDV